MKNFPNHKVRFTIYRTVYEHRTVVVLTYKFITGEKRSSFRFVDVLEKKLTTITGEIMLESILVLLLDTFRDRRREKTGGTRYQCCQPKPLKFSRSRE